MGGWQNINLSKGTGFGLLSAQKIVEAHGGQLWIEGHENGAPESAKFASSGALQEPMLEDKFLTAFVMSFPLKSD